MRTVGGGGGTSIDLEPRGAPSSPPRRTDSPRPPGDDPRGRPEGRPRGRRPWWSGAPPRARSPAPRRSGTALPRSRRPPPPRRRPRPDRPTSVSLLLGIPSVNPPHRLGIESKCRESKRQLPVVGLGIAEPEAGERDLLHATAQTGKNLRLPPE